MIRVMAALACAAMGELAVRFAIGAEPPAALLAGLPMWLWWWPAALWFLLAGRILVRGTER